ncbi:Ubiquitin-conjugating enzyme E2 [Dillenia turbinata]|uniref:Ubiquitin-conjugating enzyme E2 n=1 Tax=Dillenia turbinata TaxID=194707 RepID=A0AAN8VNX1_9MAGN
MAEDKHNLNNAAVKRILQEVKEMQQNPSDDFMSLPLEDNIFEWQFAIRGPSDTEFEGGIYHGRIQLPAEYPFQPPSFMLLTPNGCFETQTKICLSTSNHHPEHWQPSWSGQCSSSVVATSPLTPFGTFPLRKGLYVAEKIHQYMLSKAPPIPQNLLQTPNEQVNNGDSEDSETDHQNTNDITDSGDPANDQRLHGRIIEDRHEVQWNANAGPLRVSLSAGLRVSRRITVDPNEQVQQQEARSARSNNRLFTLAAIGLSIAIVVLLIKKFLKASGYGVGMDHM